MADATEQASVVATNTAQRPRRSSLRKSLNDCGLPPGYLEALDIKRRALDESIHKYIASKEREYKQYEKDLKYQAKRADTPTHDLRRGSLTTDNTVEPTSAAVEALLQRTLAPEDGLANSSVTTADASPSVSIEHTLHPEPRPQQDEVHGVFTPEYISALTHHEQERSTSEPAAGNVDADSTVRLVGRNNSDTAAYSGAARLRLSHRTSSSGSSIDGRLVSAMKSATAETSHPRRKRVSIAVGDAIVAPSDNVPPALHVKSSSSHSRPRTPRRERQAFIEEPLIASEMEQSHSEALDLLQQQGSVTAAHSVLESVDRKSPAVQPGKDVGDLFDLEDTELDDDGTDHILFDDDAGSSQESLPDAIAGRVGSSISPDTPADTDLQIEPNEPPPDVDLNEMQDVPLTPTTGPASKQPADAGFRRPSAIHDPVYRGDAFQQTSREAEEGEVYSSSFSRPTSKGSFTSGSLGESYMARNAEAMMEMRSQQQRQESRHRSPHASTALPVR